MYYRKRCRQTDELVYTGDGCTPRRSLTSFLALALTCYLGQRDVNNVAVGRRGCSIAEQVTENQSNEVGEAFLGRSRPQKPQRQKDLINKVLIFPLNYWCRYTAKHRILMFMWSLGASHPCCLPRISSWPPWRKCLQCPDSSTRCAFAKIGCVTASLMTDGNLFCLVMHMTSKTLMTSPCSSTKGSRLFNKCLKDWHRSTCRICPAESLLVH